jgi:hypothetical protein
MSWLTQIARNIGLGGVLDAIDAAEKQPSAASIGAALGSIIQAAPNLPADAPVAVADLGSMVSQTVVGAAAKVNPALGGVAATLVPGILNAVETAVMAELQKL